MTYPMQYSNLDDLIRKQIIDKLAREKSMDDKKPKTGSDKKAKPLPSPKAKVETPVKAKPTKHKPKPVIITRTIDLSSLVNTCVHSIEGHISDYIADLDISFSKEERRKVIKAIKDNLKD